MKQLISRDFEIILHVGSHRTGTTFFQHVLRDNSQYLQNQGVTFWGPPSIRNKKFFGMFRNPSDLETSKVESIVKANTAVLKSDIEGLIKDQQTRLLISEENILGNMRDNFRQEILYPDASKRLSLFENVFGAFCGKVSLTIRPYEQYWASAAAFLISRGRNIPSQEKIDRIAFSARTWRQIISEIVQVFPAAEIVVWNFESFVEKPEVQVQILTNQAVKLATDPVYKPKNVSPSCEVLQDILINKGDFISASIIGSSGKYFQPFSNHQIQHFRQAYEADLEWLLSGADGKVTFHGNYK